MRQQQTAKQKADKQPGSLYKKSTYKGIINGLQRHLQDEYAAAYRASGSVGPAAEINILHSKDPYWRQFRSNVDATLRK